MNMSQNRYLPHLGDGYYALLPKQISTKDRGDSNLDLRNVGTIGFMYDLHFGSQM